MESFFNPRDVTIKVTPTSSDPTATGELPEKASIYAYSTGLHGVNQDRNALIKDLMWWSLGVLAILILAVRLMERVKAKMRLISTMAATAQQQSYWAQNRYGLWKLKKYILYAPLWKKRHNREIRLSSAANMGTIPSRLHTILLIAYGISNLVYCIWLDYGVTEEFRLAADLRGRSGILAAYNMVALIIFAGRNNPLIGVLQISFDTYNLFHRWIGRIVVIEVVIHTFAWAYVRKAAVGWSGVFESAFTDPFLTSGVIGTIAMVLILMASLSPVRHAFYETFLNAHIIMAMLALVGTLIHCWVAKLIQLPVIWAVISLWLAERLARMARIIYYNYSSKGWTSASIETFPGDACLVTMHLPRHVDIKPGTHAYLRFSTVNAWESHPFSIAWTEERSFDPCPNVLPMTEDKLENYPTHTDVSFIIHAQSGMTKKLFDKACAYEPQVLNLKAAFEGPYGGHHSLDSFGHAVLFAGSSGITHQLLYVRHLINGFNQSQVSTRKITLVWTIRDPEHLEWVRPWMDSILHMPNRRDILTIKVYVTRPQNPKQITSPSATVQMYPGRPNISTLMMEEADKQVGAMCVTVCGPGAMADDVRHAVRNVQHRGSIAFIEEGFTW